jgi:hypothetical protein
MNRQEKIHKVMREFKHGKLHDSHGNLVTKRDQAIAIAISEANRYKNASINLRHKYLTTPQQKMASNNFYTTPKYVDFETWKQVEEIKESRQEIREKLATQLPAAPAAMALDNEGRLVKIINLMKKPSIATVGTGVATGIGTTYATRLLDKATGQNPNQPLIILLDEKTGQPKEEKVKQEVEKTIENNQPPKQASYDDQKAIDAAIEKLKELKKQAVVAARTGLSVGKSIYRTSSRGMNGVLHAVNPQGLRNI